MSEPRSLSQKKSDTLRRLEHDKDFWISSSSGKGDPYLVPLSFWWDGTSLFISTYLKNQTAQNIIETGKVRIALGHTRDVTLIEASATLLEQDEIKECADAFTQKCGWDPRESKGYRFFRLEPRRIEIWRELNEHSERVVMKDGKWVV